MRARFNVTCLLATLLLSVGTIGGQTATPSPAALLRQAMDKETIEGDILKAYDMYRSVAEMPSAPADVRGRALLRMGDAASRLGRPDATASYNRVVEEFRSQVTLVRVAQERLARSTKVKRSERLICERRGCDGVVSPNGRLVAFRENAALRLRDLDAGTVRTFNDTPLPPALPLRPSALPLIAWRDDSAMFAYGMNEPADCGSRAPKTPCHYVIRTVTVRDGRVNRLSAPQNGGLEAWAHSGKRLLISDSKPGNFESTTFKWLPLDGGAPQTIGEVKGSSNGGTLSPDDRFLAFTFTENSHGDDGLDVIELSTLRRATVSSTSAGYPEPIAWSADGKFLLFAKGRRPRSLWAVRMVNGQPQEAAFVVDRRNSNGDVLMRPGTLLMKTPVDVWLYTAPLDPITGKITAAAVPLGDASIDGARPRYSPDGQAIAYVIAGDDAPVLKVYQLAVNRDLTFQPARGILRGVSCWSADGNSVVFNSRRFPANDLVLSSLNVRNKEETIPATQSSFALQTCVGDLGAGVADNSVRVRNLRDASERVVYSPPGGVAVSDPVLSRDGARLAFFERRNPASVSLRVIPTSGGMPRELATFTDPSSVDAFHRRIAWSHDNRFVYFSRLIDNDEYETFRVPVDGGAATSTNYKGPGAVGIDLAPDGNHIVSRWGRENSAEIWALENFLPTAR